MSKGVQYSDLTGVAIFLICILLEITSHLLFRVLCNYLELADNEIMLFRCVYAYKT